jgi:hypothetical protein
MLTRRQSIDSQDGEAAPLLHNNCRYQYVMSQEEELLPEEACRFQTIGCNLLLEITI